MRKTVLFFIVTFFLLGSLSFSADSFAKSVDIAEIFSLQGDVKVKLAKAQDWIQGTLGMILNEGDSVKTGGNSMAVISLDPVTDKNLIKLESNSTVVLTSLKAKLTVIELSAGKVLSSVENLQRRSEFKIHTPTAIAGVRGTGFSAVFTGKQAEFAAYKNKILVEALDKLGKIIDKKTVDEGFKVIVELFKEIGDLMEISEQDRKSWNEWKGNIASGGPAAQGNVSQSMQEVTTLQDEQDKIEQGEVDNVFDSFNREEEHHEQQGGGSCP